MARPKGTVKFKWNETTSSHVEKLAMIGLNDDQIAGVEEMSESTLRKLYNKELCQGRNKGIAAVAQNLYTQALDKKNLTATLFYLKCRGRWREVHTVEHSGPDGKQIPIKTEHVILNNDQIKRIAEETLRELEPK